MMNNSTYHAPQTITATIALLSEAIQHGETARLMAGGTVLVPHIKAGLPSPTRIVNLKHISDLKIITPDDHGLRLGPLVTPTTLIRSPIIQEHYPVLAQASATMAGVQIRNMATIGGNICNAAPGADLIPALIILQATIQIQGPAGVRSLPIEQFFSGPGQTILRPDELVTEISLPWPAATISAIYIKHALRQAMAVAMVGVGVAVQCQDGICEEVRIALGAVAPIPMRARRAETELRGQPLTDELIASTAKQAAEESDPGDDVRSSAWYRRRMVEVLTRRALQRLRVN